MNTHKYPKVIEPIKRRGFYGIGIEAVRSTANIGTIWRSAQVLGADFIFIIGKRYSTLKTDTLKSWRHIPLLEYDNFEQFYAILPKGAKIVGVELHSESEALTSYTHPQQAVYLMGIVLYDRVLKSNNFTVHSNANICNESDMCERLLYVLSFIFLYVTGYSNNLKFGIIALYILNNKGEYPCLQNVLNPVLVKSCLLFIPYSWCRVGVPYHLPN